MAVQIVVADSDAHTCLLHAIFAQGRTPQNSFFTKRSISIVHEQKTGSGVASDVDILPSVFIKIRRYDRHAIGGRGARDAGLLTYIREGSVAVVSIKEIPARG